jgi:hypothetical protein
MGTLHEELCVSVCRSDWVGNSQTASVTKVALETKGIPSLPLNHVGESSMMMTTSHLGAIYSTHSNIAGLRQLAIHKGQRSDPGDSTRTSVYTYWLILVL